MIPMQYITEWRNQVLWQDDAMVEQDLVIGRALIEIFNNDQLKQTLAFRGGTALHKLFFNPAGRYSEDLDFVQVKPAPIGETFDTLRKILDPWLGTPKRKLKEGRANLYYRYQQEGKPGVTQRLKIEINTREHFSVMPYEGIPFNIDSQWYQGAAEINSFHFNELIGTKFRALYQRKKGRDLFDLWLAVQHPQFIASEILHCFHQYIAFESKSISRAAFERNLLLKLKDPVFSTDITPLLRVDSAWNAQNAYDAVHDALIATLPGEPWVGTANNCSN